MSLLLCGFQGSTFEYLVAIGEVEFAHLRRLGCIAARRPCGGNKIQALYAAHVKSVGVVEPAIANLAEEYGLLEGALVILGGLHLDLPARSAVHRQDTAQE